MKTHLRTRTDIFATLQSFKPLESEFILFEDSQTETMTFAARYQALRRQGVITGIYSFTNSENPKGTTITRKS